MRYDVIVIGSGIAGLVAATRLAQNGRKTLLLAKGIGATHLSSGCVDVLGYTGQGWIANPAAALADFNTAHPQHPYALAGNQALENGLAYFIASCHAAGLEYSGSISANQWLPTAAGAVKPTCLAQQTQAQTTLTRAEPLLVVGFPALRDFYPLYLADNLKQAHPQVAETWQAPIEARAVNLDLPDLANRPNLSSLDLARYFERPDFRAQVIRLLKKTLRPSERVAFPAVLGVDRHHEVVADLEQGLGAPIGEIATLPPSVPGIRLYMVWRQAFLKAGGRYQVGFPVGEGQTAKGRATQVSMLSTVRPVYFQADEFVLATGGLGGYGLVSNFEGQVREAVFGLPVYTPGGQPSWFAPQARAPQPYRQIGIRANTQLQPLDERGQVALENVRVVGASLAHWDGPREKSGDGVTIATAFKAVDEIIGTRELREAV